MTEPPEFKPRGELSGEYHVQLSDEERKMIEQQSFNFFQLTGKKMKVPPLLASDLKAGGVNMKYLEADRGLEN